MAVPKWLNPRQAEATVAADPSEMDPMRTDREALIAGIAADPHNDLRKLVFADWLEEHGEPDRAEFIRLAIGNKNPDTRTKVTEKRAKALFAKHWRTWFGPFFEALDPGRGAKGVELKSDWYQFEPLSGSHPWFKHRIEAGHGMVTGLGLDLTAIPSGCSLDQALRFEPVFYLSLSLGAVPRWKALTGPTLDQLQSLFILDEAHDGERLAEFERMMNDRNLTGVTDLSLYIHGPGRGATPVPVAEAFTASRLARAVRKLQLFEFDSAGLRLVCESRRLKLERVELRGRVSRRWGELLASARFATSTKVLDVQDSGSGPGRVSPMITALCDGKRWKALTELRLHADDSDAGVTATGLKALAKASFLSQLEVLSIPLDNKPNPKFVAAVVERLDPARVRNLTFERRGDVPMPECFVRKFGDRAQEQVDEEHGNSFWSVVPPPNS